MSFKYVLLFVVLSIGNIECDIYDDKVILTVSMKSKSVLWSHTNSTLTSLGCDKHGKFAFFTHGFQGAGEKWINTLNRNLLKHRGGCIIHLDWGEFSKDLNYLRVRWNYFPNLSALLVRKLKQMEAEGIDPANIFMYGHSLGARMVVDAALKFGPGKIGMIDACDPAGPEFYIYDITVDPKEAAKNVQTIHTCNVFGTPTRKSHQDFIMGKCGLSQPAARNFCKQQFFCPPLTTEAAISHILCNDFYNSAFENPFLADDTSSCVGTVDVKSLPAGYKMGYDESRTPIVTGIIPVPTSEKYPYNVI